MNKYKDTIVTVIILIKYINTVTIQIDNNSTVNDILHHA